MSLADCRLLDTTSWRSVCDVTLTLKQARRSDDGRCWFRGNDHQYRAAFKHFMKRLNYAVYGHAVRRHCRQLRAIPVMEKEIDGRWHYHAALEPPAHIEFGEFRRLIEICWLTTHWAYRINLVRPNADQGWVEYMLDWGSLNNPIAGA
jgi:hypothetical protein